MLAHIPTELRAQTVRLIDVKADVLPRTKTLGQSWAPDKDVLLYNMHVLEQANTRRGIL